MNQNGKNHIKNRMVIFKGQRICILRDRSDIRGGAWLTKRLTLDLTVNSSRRSRKVDQRQQGFLGADGQPENRHNQLSIPKGAKSWVWKIASGFRLVNGGFKGLQLRLVMLADAKALDNGLNNAREIMVLGNCIAVNER